MPGDSGIFATCNKGREPKCVGELRDLFSEYAEQLYGNSADEDEDNGNGAEGIENDIKAELAGIQKPPTAQLFVPVKLDVQCGELTRAASAFTFAYRRGKEARADLQLQWFSSRLWLPSSRSASCRRSAKMPWRIRCTRGPGRRSVWRL
jgi:hypothetical protein